MAYTIPSGFWIILAIVILMFMILIMRQRALGRIPQIPDEPDKWLEKKSVVAGRYTRVSQSSKYKTT